MTLKSANVVARVEPEIKQQAENILAEIGLSSSSVINALYKQIIIQKGIPFSMVTYQTKATNAMVDKEQLNILLAEGLRQAKANEGGDLAEMFSEIRRRHRL